MLEYQGKYGVHQFGIFVGVSLCEYLCHFMFFFSRLEPFFALIAQLLLRVYIFVVPGLLYARPTLIPLKVHIDSRLNR